MLAGEEEVVRAWYHEQLPGGMEGDWRKEASEIEKALAAQADAPSRNREIMLNRIRRARMLRGCAELLINKRLHIDFTGRASDYKNCVWCHTGISHGC